MLADPHTLSLLQQRTRQIRNICILAHVDHGKTTLSDYLLSSNGIISPKLAGKVRFLDSRPDEQDRGITMKSSSIALLFNDKRHLTEGPPATPASGAAPAAAAAAAAAGSAPAAAPSQSASDLYLINLIDCPGHVDFSSEVSNAVRVSDGCLVLVDVLEGICVQTHAVLRTAWNEGVKPVLVLNKIDRLVSELQMSAMDAYRHIGKILEQVNVITSTFITADSMAAAAARASPASASSDSSASASSAPAAEVRGSDGSVLTAHEVDIDDSKQWIFSPEKGNVVFASAFDCWAFSLPQFAGIIAAKLGGGMKPAALQRVLWGDYYFNGKDKSVSKKPPKGAAKPMFVQMIFEPLFQLYHTVLQEDSAATQAIINALGLKILPRELSASKDARNKLQTILSRWLPIPAAVLGAVVDHLPDPVAAQQVRMDKFWPAAAAAPPAGQAGAATGAGSVVPLSAPAAMVEAVRLCDKESEHVLIYVSKMLDMGEMLRKLRDSATAATAAKIAMASGAGPAPAVRGAYQRGKFTAGASAAPAAAPEAGAATPAAEPSAVAPVVAAESALVPSAPSTSDAALDLDLDDDTSRFVGLARIWCGTLRAEPKVPTTLHIFGPKYDPADAETHALHRSSITIGGGDGATHRLALFLLMGSDMQSMAAVPAGNVFAIGGLGALVHNTATLSTLSSAIPFAQMRYQSAPIVRVAIETESVGDMKHLLRGLKLLNQADANVQVVVLDTGEHVVVASGELHLERCIRDLKDRFCPPGIALRVSPPLISFRETVAEDLTVEAAKRGPRKAKKTREDRRKEEAEEEAELDLDRKTKEGRKKKEVAAAAAAAAVKPSASLEDLSAAAAGLNVGGGEPSPAPASSVRSASEVDAASVAGAAPAGLGVPKTARYKHVIEEVSPNRALCVWVQAIPMPIEVTQALEAAQPLIRALAARNAPGAAGAGAGAGGEDDAVSATAAGSKGASDLASLVALIRSHFTSPQFAHLFSAEDVARIWACGPRSVGPNLLLNRVDEFAHLTALFPRELTATTAAASAASLPAGSPSMSAAGSSSARAEASPEREALFLSYSNALLSGFQLACAAGPLCEEPLMGVAFALERFEVLDVSVPRNTGQALGLMRGACRSAYQARSPRLMEAMYRVQLQCETNALGALYGVLSRRRGRIISEELREGTTVFLVEAFLPVADSFGFAGDVRKQTGGEASPQLLFSHWEVIPQDPFFVPRSEEELEFHGAVDATPNLARDLVDHVRRRKGLAVKEKVVQHAEKQRTIKH